MFLAGQVAPLPRKAPRLPSMDLPISHFFPLPRCRFPGASLHDPTWLVASAEITPDYSMQCSTTLPVSVE
jgi:hypothetical protein